MEIRKDPNLNSPGGVRKVGTIFGVLVHDWRVILISRQAFLHAQVPVIYMDSSSCMPCSNL